MPLPVPLPCGRGMRILTNSPRVRQSRIEVVNLILSEHEGNCSWCERSEDCELKALAYELGIQVEPEVHGENREPSL